MTNNTKSFNRSRSSTGSSSYFILTCRKMIWILWLLGFSGGGRGRDGQQSTGGTPPLVVVSALESQQQQQQSSAGASSSSSWIDITNDTFESGWGNYQKQVASSKNVRRTNTKSCGQGVYSIELKDSKPNGVSSMILKQSYDVSSYTNLQVEFTFVFVGYETNDGDRFLLEYSSNNGNSWITVEEFSRSSGLLLYPNNNVCYSVVVDFESKISNLVLTQNSKIRFTSVAGSKDKVYIDNVTFRGLEILTSKPSTTPSSEPTIPPTSQPSISPSNEPTIEPSTQPTIYPSSTPSMKPSASVIPSMIPSRSVYPSFVPSIGPTSTPSTSPTIGPTQSPTTSPSLYPSSTPTKFLTVTDLCPKSRIYPPMKHSIQPYQDTNPSDTVEDDLEEISSLAFSHQTDSLGNKYAYVVSDKRQMSIKVLKLYNDNPNILQDTYHGIGDVVAVYTLFTTPPTIGDWEDISLGPCTDIPNQYYNLHDVCIYVGDIGNNNGQNRKILSIYKFVEPTIDFTTGPTSQIITTFTTINFSYGVPFVQDVDKYYNAETLMVDWKGVASDPNENPGDIYIVSKGGCSTAGIGKIPVSVHRDIPPGTSNNVVYDMPKIGPLPNQGIHDCNADPYREFTGGDIRADGQLIALIRVGPPAAVYYFARTADQSILSALVGADLSGDSPSQCDYVSSVSGGLTNEYQYEAVAFVDPNGYRIGEISECQVAGCTPTLYQFELEYPNSNFPPISEPVSDWYTITFDTFEGNTWGTYQNLTTATGENAIISNERSCGDGSSIYSLRLNEDRGEKSSAWHVISYDCSSYDMLRITFQYRFLGYDHLDTLFLEISFDGGTNYFMVSDWAYSVAESTADNIFLDNEVCYDGKVVLVPSQFSSPSVSTTTFTSQVKLRFRNSGNAGNDRAYIDNILFEGHDATGA